MMIDHKIIERALDDQEAQLSAYPHGVRADKLEVIIAVRKAIVEAMTVSMAGDKSGEAILRELRVLFPHSL